MWLYKQSTGEMRDPKGKLVGIGFAGHSEGLNNPAQQQTRNVGPLPVGAYRMVQWYPSHNKVGAGVIQLSQDPGNTTFGRSGFFIHGLNILDPLHSSDGCIVFGDIPHRYQIWQNGDRDLQVVA